jgi:hypothetical protein
VDDRDRGGPTLCRPQAEECGGDGGGEEAAARVGRGRHARVSSARTLCIVRPLRVHVVLLERTLWWM